MITIDPDGALPPYEQIRSRVAEQVASGELVTGTRLPTVRALAAELGVAVNTVGRAYRELEEGGYVRTEGRAGTFVHTPDRARSAAEAAARAYAAAARAAGLSDDDGVRLLRAVWEA